MSRRHRRLLVIVLSLAAQVALLIVAVRLVRASGSIGGSIGGTLGLTLIGAPPTNTPAPTATPTNTPAVAIDLFDRAAIGTDWTQASYDGGAACEITGSSDLRGSDAGGGQDALCYYNLTTPATASYTCGQSTSTPTGGAYGCVCQAITNGTTDDGVCCCLVGGAGVINTINSYVWNNSSVTDTPLATGLSLAVPIYIGINRVDADTFNCATSTNGTTWTARGANFDLETGTGGPSSGGGNAGAFFYLQSITLECWASGAGSLPTSTACCVAP